MQRLAWSDLERYDWLGTPIWALGLQDGCVHWANAAAATCWSRASAKELVGCPMAELVQLSSGDFADLHAQAEQTGRAQIAARLLGATQGAQAMLAAQPLVLEHGGAGLCLQAHQVTTVDPIALRGVEAVLHFSLTVVMFDLQGRVLMQNPAALRAFPALAQAEANGFFSLMDNKAEATQIWRAAVEFGADQGERQFSSRPKPSWYAYSLHQVLDPVSSQIAMLLTAQDITERVESEQKFRVLFEQAANPLLLFDPALGRVADCNRAAAQALRLPSRKQLIDTDPARFYPPRQPDGSDSRTQAAALVDEAIRRGWQRFEWMFRRSDDSELLVEITLSPVNVGDRKLLLMAWYDLSFRRLIERQLRDAKEAAEAASRAKSLFLANMSHEIRTPLNAIVGMAGLLQDAGMDEAQRQRLEIVRFSAAGLVDLVDDILDFSRIEAGKLTIEAQIFDLHALLSHTAELLRFSAEQKGLSLSLQQQPDLPRHIEADEGRLRQLLVNLAGNAIKFTAQGRVELQVELEQEAGSSPMLGVTVTDTGIGIEADKLEAIFEPFTQGDDSTSRRYGGSGLGLTISRRLVEAMQGRLNVLSQPGVGSRFRFSIPVVLAAKPPAMVRVDVAPCRPLRVLLAEDNPMNQVLARTLLEQDGHEVTLAVNGHEALQQVEANAFDLVLMDMQMPEMDGLSATLAIRALGLAGQLPIIAMTANVLPEDKARCLAVGMDDFLSKPIAMDRLRQILQAVAQQPAAVMPSARQHADGLFDPAEALAVCGGNAALLHTLAAQFLEEWPERRHTLEQAWSAGDMVALGQAIHLLKGSLGALAYSQGVSRAQAAEQMAKRAEMTPESYAVLQATLAAFVADLQRFAQAES